MHRARPSHLLGLSLWIVAAVGCSRSPPAIEPVAPTPPAAPAPAPGEEHVKLADVSIDRGANVALPAGFPADVPVPPGAELTDAVQMGNINIIGFRLPSAPDATFAALLPLYQAQGWKNYSRVDGQPVMGTDGFEKDGRKLIYTVVPDGSGSKVSLRIYPKAG